MAIDRVAARQPSAVGSERVVGGAFAAGALLLGAEAAVHVQQYAALVYSVRWIGPLFVANATAGVAAVVGLAFARTRQFAALAGIVISAGALASLVVSYGRGLFGFYEAGFRPAIAVAVITELGAVILLSTALAATNALVQARDTQAQSRRADEVLRPTDNDLTTTGGSRGFVPNTRRRHERVDIGPETR
jgi:hypothetical protein